MSEKEFPDADSDRRAETVRCIQAEAHSKRCWAQAVSPNPRRTTRLLGSHHRGRFNFIPRGEQRACWEATIGDGSTSFQEAIFELLRVSPISGNWAIRPKNIVSSYNRVASLVHLSTPSQSLPNRNESPHDGEVQGSPTVLNVSRSRDSRFGAFVRRM